MPVLIVSGRDDMRRQTEVLSYSNLSNQVPDQILSLPSFQHQTIEEHVEPTSAIRADALQSPLQWTNRPVQINIQSIHKNVQPDEISNMELCPLDSRVGL